MDTLLQQFEAPIVRDGETYAAWLYGRERADGMWEGWIVFERASDRARSSTPVETTQSNAQAIVYWATGLGHAYFDGALQRAQAGPAPAIDTPAMAVPPPLVTAGRDTATRESLREDLEAAILDVFSRRNATQLLTQDIFDSLPHSRADIVRAFEHLQKGERRIVRRTEQGNDWVFLI
jgi:hypothetical protein